MTTAATPEKTRPTLSKPAMRVALRVIQDLKEATEHHGCDRKVCETAQWRYTHCKHGTYVGDWAGPDYLCGPCEDDVSDYAYALAAAWDEQHRRTALVRDAMAQAAVAAMGDHPDAAWLASADAIDMVKQACDISGRRFW